MKTERITPEIRLAAAKKIRNWSKDDFWQERAKRFEKLAKDALRKRNERMWAGIRREVEQDIPAL